MTRTACANCGYERHDSASSNCPECGLTCEAAERQKRCATRRVLLVGFAVITGTYVLGLLVSCFWPDQFPVDGGNYGAHFPIRRATIWPFYLVLPPFSLIVSAALVIQGLRRPYNWPYAMVGFALAAFFWFGSVVFICWSNPFD